MIPLTLEIFLPCYFGNELSVALSRLSIALFGSKWLDCNNEFKTTMKIFMENTKKDIKISAFGIFDVNLATFRRIINSAYSYFAVLRNIYN
jgi:hypothetical protein